MKVLRSQASIPRDFSTHPEIKGLLLQKDIGIGHGRLKAKLLVFQSTKDLRHFWKNALEKGDLGKTCRGAVNGLFCEVLNFSKGKQTTHLEVDPWYFCVIGLVQNYLTMEIISHEAVHAAFSFRKRKSRTPWDVQAKDMDEEGIAYPAGRIAGEINRVLHAKKLYQCPE